MKKKFIFFTMLLLTLMGGVKLNVLNAQEIVTIGDVAGSSTTGLYPFYGSVSYSISQNVYTSADLKNHTSGSISAVGLKKGTTKNYVRNVSVYLKNTEKVDLSEGAIPFSSTDCYFTGDINTGVESVGDWITINLNRNFEYDGTNIMVVMIENGTGQPVTYGTDKYYRYSSGGTLNTLLYKSSVAQFDVDNYPLSGASGSTYKTTIQFTFSASVPSVKITPESIDLGTVRTDANFFTEKPFEPKVVTVRAIGGAIINSIDTDDDFFKIEFEDEFTPGQDEYTLHINYNRNAETGSKTGNLVVTYDTDKTATISLSAYAYAATEGDAIEEPIVVAFNNNAFTHAATGMHDDYILPGEENDGNNGDAVYKFTLENDAVLTANVTGTNPIVAIYNEFGNNEGPSSDNNNEGAGNDAGPTAPTIFGPYTFDNEAGLDDFTIIDKDNDGYKWYVGYNMYIGSTCLLSDTKEGMDNHIVTKNKYLITDNSKLNFKLNSYNQEVIGVEVSENGVDYENVHEYVYGPMSTGTQDVSIDLSSCQGKEVYIAIYHNKYVSSSGYRVAIDNLELTGTATNTNQNESIDRVLYPADTYYLVAAADGDFTLYLSTETLTAPEPATLTAPANEATEKINPLLTWTLDKFAEEYQLLLGKTNPPTDVVVNWSAPATSYQTEGLENHTVYYWQVKSRNSVGESSSAVFSFVTPLNKPTNVTAYETNLYPGDETTISWTEADGATSYNVYVGETEVASEVTETSYTLSGLEYNVNPGHNVTVTANHTLGESAKSDAVVVKMTAKSTVTLTVKNAAGNPVEGATVKIYNGKDQYGATIAEQTFTTNANGQVVEDLLYLYGDNTAGRYYFEVTKAPYSTYDYNSTYDYIYYSYLNNPTYSKEIKLQLAVPTISITDNTLYPGETLEVTWDDIDGAENYTIYIEGEEIKVIENSPYTLVVDNTDYNMNNHYNYGDYIEVKANYGALGSSARSGSYYKVTGYNDITGTITNGAGATLTFTGTDEFGAAQTFTTTVGDDDKYTMENVLAGTYTVTASKFDYQDLSEELEVIYATTLTFDSEMTANPAADASLLSNVAVTEVGENAQITWTGAFNNTQMYNIYRKNVETGVVKLVAENQNNTNQIYKSYLDTDYATSEVDDGTYQYGVTTMVESDMITVLNESFNNGIPAGWTKGGTGGYASGSTYCNSAPYGYYMGYSQSLSTLTTSEIDLSGYVSAPTLSMYYKNGYGNTFKIYVKVSGDPSWTLINTISSNIFNFTQLELTLSDTYKGKTIQIMFECSKGSAYTCIDDIVIKASKLQESATVWSNEIKKGGIVFTNNDGAGDGKWEIAGNWKNGNAPTLNDGTEEVTIKASATISSDVNVKYLAISGSAYLTVNKDATLTVTGELVNNDEYGLTIIDGAQVFHNSENVKARFAMNIVAPETWSSENKDGWQFIAAPFVNNTASIANFTSPNNYSTIVYDLYKYDGVVADQEWDNQKDNPGTWGYFFENGVGYLASYAEASTAYLSGTLNNASSHTWNFTYNNDEQPLANFHLLGNPFTFDMDMTQATFNNLVNGVAIVNDEGGYTYDVKSIPVGDGFFVKTTGKNPSFSYNAASKATRGEKANSLNVIATSNAGNDNVVINFAGEQEGFPKMRNFNDAIATVYVQDKDANYGIYNCDENTTEVELCFNANQMGNYTISIEPNGKFQTVTLVDRFTGIETNMLLEDYSFTAMSEENNNRFILKLAVSDQQSAVSDNFVYQSGEELIVDAEGTVQIIDVMGRVVYNNDVTSDNNRINVSDFNNGAYVVRVINESEIKVEKVVIY